MKSKEKPVAVFEQDMAAFAVDGQRDVMNSALAQQGIDSGSKLQRWGAG